MIYIQLYFQILSLWLAHHSIFLYFWIFPLVY